MRYIFLITVFSCLCLTVLSSQENRPYRKFTTQKVHRRLLEEDKSISVRRQNIERKTAKHVTESKEVTIPIVFHIVYSSEEEKVSEQQVRTQIQALNRDFSNLEYKIQHPADTLEGFSKLAVDTEIRFCFAGETPNNKTTSGITYTYIPKQSWIDNDAIKNKKDGVSPWKPDRYLNVWVASLDGTSGYAQMPGGPDKTDGIVIDYRYFGIGGTSVSPYDQGKTLTHLVGSYLGLYELWSEDNYCNDDYVTDTPIHSSPNFGCPGYEHVSLCLGNVVEMTMNFMDNTDDNCQYMFTAGQKIRMQANLSKGGAREKLAISDITIACKLEGDFYESMVQVDQNNQPRNVFSPFSVEVFPNPTQGKIQLKIFTNQSGSGTIEGFSVLGDRLFFRKEEWMKGQNNLTVDSEAWESGTYYFRIKMNEETNVVKAIISK